MSRLPSLAYKIYGEPPPKGAPRSQVLRWIRGFYVKSLPLTLVSYVMLLIWTSSTWVIAVGAFSAAVWLQGLVSLSLRIRREENRN